MVASRRKLFLSVTIIFVILEPLGATLSGSDFCSAKFDSEYEDACLRGCRMKEEAEKYHSESFHGVTCENSCDDIYKDDAKSAKACKYGCDIKLPAMDEDRDMWDQLMTMMINQFKKVQKFFTGQSTLSPGSIEHRNQKVGVKKDGTLVRHIQIVVPLGQSSFTTVQRSAKPPGDGENLFEKLNQLLGFPSPSGTYSSDETVKRNNQQEPRHSQQSRLWLPKFHLMMPSRLHEEKDMTSADDQFLHFVRHVNPIVAVLVLVLVFILIFSIIQLTICVCRRRTRSAYMYNSLPAYVEEAVPYYPAELEEKRDGEEKTGNPKDAKEALGV